jgi:uncharacterized protein YajQ (UPF0234 family)
MASFDIVSEVDFQEIDNAVNTAVKEMVGRFDFKGTKSSINLEKAEKKIKIVADDEFKLRSIHMILEQKLSKRNVDLRVLDYGKEEQSGQLLKQEVKLRSGIEQETAKKITKLIKDSKLKVQAQIQDEQVRVTGKKIDDLQDVIKLLRENEVGVPLQFINMRS